MSTVKRDPVNRFVGWFFLIAGTFMLALSAIALVYAPNEKLFMYLFWGIILIVGGCFVMRCT